MLIDDGFKALAYPVWNPLDPVSSLPCSLTFKCDSSARQATVLLRSRIPTSRGLQTFVLQYDATNLVPGTSLSRGNPHIPQPQLDEILRDGHSKSHIHTLALSLSQPCPVWCAASGIAPAPGSEQPFQQLAKLSQATTIHVVFDYSFVQKPYRGMFRAFSRASGGLVGYPVEVILLESGLEKKSWEVFSNAEAPPAYKGHRKRGRQSSSTSPQQSPKRVASRDDLHDHDAHSPHSPTSSHDSNKTVALSPATADAIHARLRHSSPAFDFQTSAINAAIAQSLPTALESALTNVLPTILHQTLFTTLPPSSPNTPRTPYPSLSPPSSLSSSSLSSHPRASPPPPLPPLTPLAATFLPHLTATLTAEFTTHQQSALSRFAAQLDALADAAAGDRAHATAEMMDELDEYKAEMLLIKGDAVKEVEREVESVLERGRRECEELVEEVRERLTGVWGDVDQVARGAVGEFVRREVGRWCKKRNRNQRRVVLKGGSGRGRLDGKGKAIARKALLGRKRQPEEEEWVDC